MSTHDRQGAGAGVGSFLVYSLLQGFAHAGIDNAAHIGGLLGGSLAAYLLPERFDLESFRRLTGRRTGIAFLTLSSVLEREREMKQTKENLEP